MLYKGCPKCGGDLVPERDIAGGPPDIVCLQCGHRLNAAELAALLQRSASHEKP
jgi:DNA-directed RNA polymerase subunit RPC12/RpoP